jgi:hypothetical protein
MGVRDREAEDEGFRDEKQRMRIWSFRSMKIGIKWNREYRIIIVNGLL